MAVKLSKKQQANNIALSVLRGLGSMARSINNVIEKGVDDQGTKLECSPDEVKKAFSAEQKAAVDAFLENFYEEPPKPPKAPSLPKGARKHLQPLAAEQ